MSTDLIRRVDRVEVESFVTLYEAAAEFGTGSVTIDGVTGFWSAGDDDPSFSCITNLALSPRREETLARLEEFVGERGGATIGVDTHPDLGDWANDERMAALGYREDSRECIWARSLSVPLEARDLPGDIEVTPATLSDRDDFARVLNLGWHLQPDASRGHVFAAGIGLENWYHYLARVDGQLAGIAVLFVHDRVADCFLAATLPEFRGRGVQTALIQRRLIDGITLGCDLATTQTVMDNASPRNMARSGFQPLYERRIFGKLLHD